MIAIFRLAMTCSLVSLAACEPVAHTPGDWDRKDAYQFCNAAIAHYPATPTPSCEAMSMCDNEGALTDAEHKKLYDMMAKTKDCAAP